MKLTGNPQNKARKWHASTSKFKSEERGILRERSGCGMRVHQRSRVRNDYTNNLSSVT